MISNSVHSETVSWAAVGVELVMCTLEYFETRRERLGDVDLSGGRCWRAWQREMIMADVVSASSGCAFGKYGRGRKRHFAISALLRFLFLVEDVWYLAMTPRVAEYL